MRSSAAGGLYAGKAGKRDTLGEQVASGAVTHFERYEMKGPLETGICEAVRKSTPLRPGGNAPQIVFVKYGKHFTNMFVNILTITNIWSKIKHEQEGQTWRAVLTSTPGYPAGSRT